MHTFDNELFTIRHLISDRSEGASVFVSSYLKRKRAEEAMQNVDEGFSALQLAFTPTWC